MKNNHSWYSEDSEFYRVYTCEKCGREGKSLALFAFRKSQEVEALKRKLAQVRFENWENVGWEDKDD